MFGIDTNNVEFECQGCGLIIDGYPQDDCPECGGGHWMHPPNRDIKPKDEDK